MPTDQEWVVSPSQIETWDETREGCNRKWGWRYIAGIKAEPTGSAQLGSSVHAMLERYLQFGELPDQSTREGQIASAGLHLLPEPSKSIIVEDEFTFRSPAGFLYGGRVDFQYHLPGGFQGSGPPVWVVGDHKTTGDFKWMKTPDKLQHDPQAIIYGANSLLLSGDDQVALHWVYYRTRGTPKAEESTLTLTVSEIQDRFQRLDNVSEKIHKALKVITDPLDLPANLDACRKFGGCPYQHLCASSNGGTISLGDSYRSYMSNLPQIPQMPPMPGVPAAPAAAPSIPADTQALLAQLAALQAAPPAPSAPPPPVVPDVLAQLRAAQAAPAVPQAPPVPPMPPQVNTVPLAPQAFPVPVAPPAPAPGVWADPATMGKPEFFQYTCSCGHQVYGSQLPSFAASHDGKACPKCGAYIAGSGMILAGLTQAINAPEVAQVAPAPPPVAAPTPPAGPPPNPEVEKPKTRGPGRPKKETTVDVSASLEIAQRAVWGKETMVVSQFGARCEIGPFELSDFPRDGETGAQCLARLRNEVNAMAEEERARKIKSFVAALPPGVAQ